MDLSRLMAQAQKMQNQLGKVEKELEEAHFVGSASGDAVRVEVTGKNEVVKVEIKDDLLDASNKEMLEDLLMIAFNNAVKASNDERDARMKAVTGGINIPGMF